MTMLKIFLFIFGFNLTFGLFGQTVVQISPAPDTLCYGDVFSLSASSNCSGAPLFTWFVNGDSISSSSSGTFNAQVLSSVLTIEVVLSCNNAGVVEMDTAQINVTVVQVVVDAGPDQYGDSGSVFILSATGNAPQIEWSPGYLVQYPNFFSTNTQPSETTTYMLKGEKEGCLAYDYVTIFLTDVLNIPNTFSPNEDGSNDTWVIPGVENHPNNHMLIMNRFGSVLYDSGPYNVVNAWSGMWNQKPLPEGVYYYVYETGTGSVKKGIINLLR